MLMTRGMMLPIMAYTARLCAKGVPLEVAGILKGRDFTS